MSKKQKASDIKAGYYGYSSETKSVPKGKSKSKPKISKDKKTFGIILVIVQLLVSVSFVGLILYKKLAFISAGVLAGIIFILILLLAIVLFMLQRGKNARISAKLISIIVIIILSLLMYLIAPWAQMSGKKLSKNPFVVFVSANDTFGELNTESVGRSDTNILAVVNPKTHTVLMVSTPRDYYVPVQAKAVAPESYDKLTHVGLYGNGTAKNSNGQAVTASDWMWAYEVKWDPGNNALMDTMKHLYNFEISADNYHYVKLNFTGFADLIDALGGITVNVDVPFSTKTYASYGDKDNGERKTYTYTKGKMKMDGATALTFARERHSFGSGDMQRNKNQVKVLKAIEKKAMSGTTLLHYNSIVDAIQKSFTTDMDISSSVALLQDGGTDGWNILSFGVIGTPSRNICTFTGTSLSVVTQDENSVNRATSLINMTLKGENPDAIKKQIKAYNKEQGS